MSNYTTLTGEDDLLEVFIDWADPTAGVFFRYDGGDEQSTPFQTADFDIGREEEVVRRVDEYAEGMAG